ncbi:MAG: hypothetical protein JNM76_06115 [Betaproteobacteria bacterium]|nr:hypothetical protein [Betaproteobacteria bacterium]
MKSRDIRESILAMLVLVAPVALWLSVDEALLTALAFAALGIGVAGVLASRKYLGRVRRLIRALPEASAPSSPTPASTLPLPAMERKLLGIHDLAHPVRVKRKLESRAALIVSIAMGFAVCGLIGFITLVVIHAD